MLFGEAQYKALKQMKNLAVSTNIERCGAFLRISIDAYGNLKPEEIKQAVADAINAYYAEGER